MGDTGIMKNEYVVSGSSLHLKMPNADIWVTASLEDMDTLASYRWRWVTPRRLKNPSDAYCATTTVKNGIEVLTTIDHILYGTPNPTSRLTHKNDNPADYRRMNIRYRSENRNENTFTINGDWAYLHFDNGMTAYVDTDQIDRIRQHFWKVIKTPRTGTLTVVSTMSYLGKHAVQLGKFLQNADISTTQRVHYLNGNRLDCRLCNLQMISSRKEELLIEEDTETEDTV